MSSFDVDQRLHILKVLSSDGLGDDEEILVVNRFKTSSVKEAGRYLTGLKEVNEFHKERDALITCLLGYTQMPSLAFMEPV